MKKTIITATRGTEIVRAKFMTTLCDKIPEFSYHSIKGRDFPFFYKGFKVEKKEVQMSESEFLQLLDKKD